MLFFKSLNIKSSKGTGLLDPKLKKYCQENFLSSEEVITKLLEYKKLLLEENKNMNLIGKSTIDEFDQRHFLDCLQIHKYMPKKNELTIDLGAGAGYPEYCYRLLGIKNYIWSKNRQKNQLFLIIAKHDLVLIIRSIINYCPMFRCQIYIT